MVLLSFCTAVFLFFLGNIWTNSNWFNVFIRAVLFFLAGAQTFAFFYFSGIVTLNSSVKWF